MYIFAIWSWHDSKFKPICFQFHDHLSFLCYSLSPGQKKLKCTNFIKQVWFYEASNCSYSRANSFMYGRLFHVLTIKNTYRRFFVPVFTDYCLNFSNYCSSITYQSIFIFFIVSQNKPQTQKQNYLKPSKLFNILQKDAI
jgi:hypothetical protein